MGKVLYFNEERFKRLINRQLKEVFEAERKRYPSGLKEKIEVIKTRRKGGF